MSTKSLRPEQNERLREIVRDVIAKDFSGNATAAARAFGVAQGLVSEFLFGGRGAGPKLIQGLADYTDRSIDDLYGRPALPLAAGGHQLIGSRADWPAVRDVVIAKSRRLTPLDVERVAGVSMSQPPEKLSEEFVTRLAEALRCAPGRLHLHPPVGARGDRGRAHHARARTRVGGPPTRGRERGGRVVGHGAPDDSRGAPRRDEPARFRLVPRGLRRSARLNHFRDVIGLTQSPSR